MMRQHILLAGLVAWMAFPMGWLLWFYAARPPRPWGRAAVYATMAEVSVIGLIVVVALYVVYRMVRR